jgi:carbon monoxide dehydrogenase subunit G
VKIENAFTVPAPVETLWAYLLDVERVAPCMPGAELTETVDDTTWKGKVNLKLGPVSLAFAGTVSIEERDDAEHRVVLRAKGMEQKGKGAANASVTSWLEPGEGETTVKMTADIQLTGAVAQLSRGLLPEVSKKLTAQFAECLQANMSTEAGPSHAADADATGGGGGQFASNSPPASTAKPISGFRVGLSAIWSIIANVFRRLFGRRRA